MFDSTDGGAAATPAASVSAGSVGPSSAVAGLVAALDRVGRVELAAAGLDELRADAAALLGARARLSGLLAGVVRECERRGVAEAAGVSTTAGWLRATHRLDPTAASRLVRLGRGLETRPVVAGALDAGRIDVEHAAVLLRAVEQASRLRPDLAEADLALGEQLLLDVAVVHSPGMVREVAARWVEILAPEAPVLDEQDRRDRRRLSVAPTFEGMVDVHGCLDPEGGAALLAAIEAMARPQPDDTRSPAQRRTDALAEIARLALNVGELPETQRGRPHVAVLVDLGRLAGDNPASPTPGDPSCADGHRPGGAVGAPAASDPPPAEPGPAEPAEPGPAEPVGRNPHPGRALRGSDDPLCALGVPLPGEVSRDRLGSVSWSSILADLCDASIRRVVLDPDGEIVDIGKATRTWPAAVATAIVLRDRCCTWPGCDRPPVHCDIDHVVPWWQGGSTSVSNGRLRCRYHHTLTHEGWTEHTRLDGTRYTQPPPGWDPRRRRRRRPQSL